MQQPTHLCLLRTPSTAQSFMFWRSGSSSPTPMLHLLRALREAKAHAALDSRLPNRRQGT
jgi:hypothetical protein